MKERSCDGAPRTPRREVRHPKTIAIVPWGDLVEDFLDDVGVSLQGFAEEMTGGWLFGYVEALRRTGVESVVFCFSARVEETTYLRHRQTAAPICVLPAPARYRRLRARMTDPYGWSVAEVFGAAGRRHPWTYALARDLAPYLATPIRAFARELRRSRCDAILCQEYESPRFDVSVAVGRVLGIAVFATYQGGSWQLSRLEKCVRPSSLRRSRALIVASSVEARRVREAYGLPEAKIARIPNPLDLEAWYPADRDRARAELGIGAETRLAVWHGRIDVRTKGLDLLLEAWQLVRAARPAEELALLLVGTGRDRDVLAEQLRQLQLPDVRWIGEYVLDKAAIRRYLSAGDVYVLPSRREGFPVAPLEAMACGLPVVAASAPGIEDIFDRGEQSGGLVVPAEDAEGLARCLNRLLGDEGEARLLGERARRRVTEGFSLEAVGAELQGLLSDWSWPSEERSPTR